jgi:hypothetical protein
VAGFSDKLTLIRGVCDSWSGWNENERKAACRALFWLSDMLLEEAAASHATEDCKHYVRGKLLSLQDAAEAGAKTADLDILHVQECSVCVTGMIPEDPLP